MNISKQLFFQHAHLYDFKPLDIEMYPTFIIIGKELAACIVGVAIVVHRNAYQRVVGFVAIGLVLRLGIEQGIVGTGTVLPHFIGRKGVQHRPGRVGVFVHQCLGTGQGIGHWFGVVAARQEQQEQ